MPLDVALTRYLLAVGICWVVLNVVSEWFRSGARGRPRSAQDADAVTGSEPEVG